MTLKQAMKAAMEEVTPSELLKQETVKKMRLAATVPIAPRRRGQPYLRFVALAACCIVVAVCAVVLHPNDTPLEVVQPVNSRTTATITTTSSVNAVSPPMEPAVTTNVSNDSEPTIGSVQSTIVPDVNGTTAPPTVPNTFFTVTGDASRPLSTTAVTYENSVFPQTLPPRHTTDFGGSWGDETRPVATWMTSSVSDPPVATPTTKPNSTDGDGSETTLPTDSIETNAGFVTTEADMQATPSTTTSPEDMVVSEPDINDASSYLGSLLWNNRDLPLFSTVDFRYSEAPPCYSYTDPLSLSEVSQLYSIAFPSLVGSMSLRNAPIYHYYDDEDQGAGLFYGDIDDSFSTDCSGAAITVRTGDTPQFGGQFALSTDAAVETENATVSCGILHPVRGTDGSLEDMQTYCAMIYLYCDVSIQVVAKNVSQNTFLTLLSSLTQ